MRTAIVLAVSGPNALIDLEIFQTFTGIMTKIMTSLSVPEPLVARN